MITAIVIAYFIVFLIHLKVYKRLNPVGDPSVAIFLSILWIIMTPLGILEFTLEWIYKNI